MTARADVLDGAQPITRRSSAHGKAGRAATIPTSGPAAGRPVSPGSDYKTVKEARFLSWLVSGAATRRPPTPPPCRTWPRARGKIPLVGAGSVGTGRGRDKAPGPSRAHPGRRRQGGGLHRLVDRRREPESPPAQALQARPDDTVAGWSVQAKSHAVADPEVFRMESLLADATPAAKAVSLQQGDLIATETRQPRRLRRIFPRPLGHLRRPAHQHRHRRLAQGFLARSPKTGTELPASGLPFFRLNPTRRHSTTVSRSRPPPTPGTAIDFLPVEHLLGWP